MTRNQWVRMTAPHRTKDGKKLLQENHFYANTVEIGKSEIVLMSHCSASHHPSVGKKRMKSLCTNYFLVKESEVFHPGHSSRYYLGSIHWQARTWTAAITILTFDGKLKVCNPILEILSHHKHTYTHRTSMAFELEILLRSSQLVFIPPLFGTKSLNDISWRRTLQVVPRITVKIANKHWP